MDEQKPVHVTDQDREKERDQHRDLERQVEFRHRQADDHARKADDRADRKIELSSDHEKRDGARENAKLRRHLQHVDDAARGEETGIAGERGKGHDDEQRAGKRAKLRPAEEPCQPRGRPHSLVKRDRQDRFRLGSGVGRDQPAPIPES